jgi:tetratricopeptide (TPR) repeat protein
MIQAWRAWLAQDPSLLPRDTHPTFVFPFRPESVPVLRWATGQSVHWSWTYLLALNLWALDREEEAARLLESLGRTPDFGPLYVVRAQLMSRLQGADPTPSLRRAVGLEPDNRIFHLQLIQHLQAEGEWDEALDALEEARGRFPNDFNLQLLHARALLHVDRAMEAAGILATAQVLPSENARESHKLYEQAHTLVALDAMEAGNLLLAREHLTAALLWPESLGQGRPYHPEERLVRFLLARVQEWTGDAEGAREGYEAVVEASGGAAGLLAGGPPSVAGRWRVPSDRLDLLLLPALRALDRDNELEAWGSVSPADLAESFARDSASRFNDLDGQMLLRALALGT